MGVAEEENFKREKWSSWMDERKELIRQGILHETMSEVFAAGFMGLLFSIIGISWLFSLSWADDFFGYNRVLHFSCYWLWVPHGLFEYRML